MDLHENLSSLAISPPEGGTSQDMQCPICQQKSTMTCSACRSVDYCCVEHQKLDWKNHKKVCQNFVVKETEDMGLGWFASRDLKAGVLILEELPCIQAPAWDWSSPPSHEYRKCMTCGNRVKSKKTCSTCGWPVCSDQCEKNSLHMDNECKEIAIKKIKYPPPPFWQIGMLAVCMRAKAMKARDPKKFKQVMALQDYFSTPSENKELQKVDLPPKMFEVLRGPNSLDREEFRKLLRICRLNGCRDSCAPYDFNLDESSQEFYNRVYLKSARINQSCFPNCNATYGPPPYNKIRIHTAVNIPKGEQLTIQFCTLEDFGFKSTDLRQRSFKLNGFFCKCKRCRDPTELGTFLSGIKCLDCSSKMTTVSESDDGFFLPVDPLDIESSDPEYKCRRCDVKLPLSKLMENLPTSLKDVLRDVSSLAEEESIDHKALDTLLTKYEEGQQLKCYLHKNYWPIQNAVRSLVKVQFKNLDTLNEEEMERLVKRLEYIVTVDDQLFPGSRFSQKFEDLQMLSKAVNHLGFKFYRGMNCRKIMKLRRIFFKAERARLEYLIQEDGRTQEDKLRISRHLKRLNKDGKDFERSVRNR